MRIYLPIETVSYVEYLTAEYEGVLYCLKYCLQHEIPAAVEYWEQAVMYKQLSNICIGHLAQELNIEGQVTIDFSTNQIVTVGK